MSLAAVTVKLPPYWPSDPQVWFIQAEVQFALRGITQQKTMFDYIVAGLSSDVAAEVRDLLLKPPEEEPYNKLKAALLKRTGISEQRRLQQLLQGEELGDRRPTQLLRKMRQLLGDKTPTAVDDVLFRELFLQRLPTTVRMVLASSPPATSMDELASLADRVMETQLVANPTVSTVNSTTSAELVQLQEEVQHLKQSLNAKRNPPLSRSSRGRLTSPPSSQRQSDICWYHQKFGDAARKCRAPCTKSGNTLASH